MKISFKNISRYFAIFMVFVQSFAQAQDMLDTVNIEKGVDYYLNYFSGQNPGAVVTVMKKGDIVFNKAYGLTNIENEEAMTTDRLFNLRELSKSFTAIAVFKLVEKNKLSLDDNLNDIFPDFPEYGKNIIVSNLLEHKSGLANYNADEMNSNQEIYNFLSNQNNTLFEPGTKLKYCNSDYPLLVSIIENKSGLSYQDFLKKFVFKKLSMNNTYFVDELEGKNVAPSHFKENDQYIVKSKISKVYGEDGIYMNVTDFVKYDKALYSNKILKCESLQKIFKITKLSNGENKSDYNSGWALMAKGGVRYFWQGGSKAGYTNLVLHLPDSKITVLILTNRDDGYDFLKMAIYIAKLFDKDLKLL